MFCCQGPLPRRDFLRVGLAGFASLSLPGLLKLRARADGGQFSGQGQDKSVILVWLIGGASHLDTYDPKPEATSDYRSPFAPISTKVPGLRLTEMLPHHAKIADKFTIVRSMSHAGGGHPSGSLKMLTGDPDSSDKRMPIYPDWMSVANYLRMDPARPVPNYVGVNGIHRYDPKHTIAGQAYLGPAYAPFMVNGDPNAPDFDVPDIGIQDKWGPSIQRRMTLKQRLDRLARATDTAGTMNAMDQFQSQAMTLLTSPTVRTAFDLSQEDDRVRDRYGRNRWGQQCLLARRLVEAGVQIITTTLDGPLCGRAQNWDDHAVNQHVFEALSLRLPVYDQAVSALIEDIYQRGLDEKVLVVVSGEFGRTPRISQKPSSGGLASRPRGTIQPGRDHWCNAFSNLWSGAGIQTGQVIGRTDRHGEQVVDRPVSAQDFLATIYHHLGINAAQITLPDLAGRPIPLIRDGKPVPELMA